MRNSTANNDAHADADLDRPVTEAPPLFPTVSTGLSDAVTAAGLAPIVVAELSDELAGSGVAAGIASPLVVAGPESSVGEAAVVLPLSMLAVVGVSATTVVAVPLPLPPQQAGRPFASAQIVPPPFSHCATSYFSTHWDVPALLKQSCVATIQAVSPSGQHAQPVSVLVPCPHSMGFTSKEYTGMMAQTPFRGLRALVKVKR